MTETPAQRITVIGGGFAGAMFARHLLRESQAPVTITIAEPRARLGAGVAYSASGPHQTTNVPARRISVDSDDPNGFQHWLEARGAWPADDEDFYPNRFLFGTFVEELLRATPPANPTSQLHHRRVQVTAVERAGSGFVIQAVDGTEWVADAVALATGNPAPVPLAPLAHFEQDTRVIANPWAPDALAHVQPDDRLLILGAGLTMGEVVASLSHRHRGPVVAIARRCRRPQRGMTAPSPPFGDFTSHRPTRAIALLRHFRAEVRRAEANRLNWRSIAAAVRAQAWPVWHSLPWLERRRFVRHLRPYWEALRHVMPGRVHDLLVDEERGGRLRVIAASLKSLEAAPDGIVATMRPRGAAPGSLLRERFDAIINCTGPAYATVTETDPFWERLARAGLVGPDPVGLGIAVDRNGRALDVNGVGQPDIVVLGTLARGTFGELTGVPELSRQALDAAQALAEFWTRASLSVNDRPPLRKVSR